MASSENTEERLKAALADRYRIEHEIGSGGMATVYLAEDLKHHRKVAVKVLRPGLADALGAQRFLKEIEVAANLIHPHILPVFDSGEADGFLFYVMPYIRGGSLKARLREEKQLPVELAVSLARELADALAHAHERDLVHRDVKPANILLTGDHALLADFGVAQAVAAADEGRLTQTGVSVGTPAYMSPEQAAGEQELDGRSDQYALGCVLYEMLAGQPPFTGPSGESVVRQHLTADPPLVSQVRASVPPGIEEVLTRTLAKSPADRFRTTSALGRALGGEETPWRGDPGRRSWKKSVILGGAIVFAAATAAVVASDWPLGESGIPENHLAVFPLENRTGDPKLDDVGSYAANWISAGLSRTGEVSVLDAPTMVQVLSQQGAGANLQQLARDLGAGTFMTGEITSLGDTLVLGVRISRTARGEQIHWVEAKGSAGNIRTIVDDLQKRVLAAVDLTLDEFSRALFSVPPTLEAWQAFRRGVPSWTAQDLDNAYPHFLEAYEKDTTFLGVLIVASAALSGAGEWGRLDSVLTIMEPRKDELDPYGRTWFDYYSAMLSGDLEGVYRVWRAEYDRSPDVGSKPYMRGVAAIGVGRVEEAVRLFEEMDPDHPLPRPFPGTWAHPALADHLTGGYERELELARQGRDRFPRDLELRESEMRALVALGRVTEIGPLLDEVEGMEPEGGRSSGRVFLQVAANLARFRHPAEARRVAQRAFEWFQARDSAGHARGRAEALLLADRPEEAQPLLSGLAEESPEDLTTRGLLGVALARIGDQAGAEVQASWCGELDRPYLWGAHTYWQAAILTHLDRNDEAADLLWRAHGEGRSWARFHDDAYLTPLRGHPRFEDLLRPKG
ncbi:protein kinase [Gemmatimonadota bacterium]